MWLGRKLFGRVGYCGLMMEEGGLGDEGWGGGLIPRVVHTECNRNVFFR